MKKFVIGVFLLALCAGALADELMDKHLKECLKENDVSEEEFSTFEDAKMSPAAVSENMKCAFKCFMVKQKFMDESGKVDEAALTKHPNRKANEAVVEKCIAIDEEQVCEKAFKITMCIIAEEEKVKQQH